MSMLRSLQFALRGSGETGTISGGLGWGGVGWEDFVTMTAGYRRQIGWGTVKMNYVPGHVYVCVCVFRLETPDAPVTFR